MKKKYFSTVVIVILVVIAGIYLLLTMDRGPANVVTIKNFDITINKTTIKELKDAGFSVTGSPTTLSGKKFTAGFPYEISKSGIKYGKVSLANYSNSEKNIEDCVIVLFYSNNLDSNIMINGKDYKGYNTEQIQKEFGEPNDTSELSYEVTYYYTEHNKEIKFTFDPNNDNILSTICVSYDVQ